MQIVTNDDRIAKGARLGKIGTFAGLGLLVVGMIVSLMLRTSAGLWLSLGCLVVGLLVSSVGTANMNRWVREPRADQALAQALKGFDDRYQLYSYFLPAPHVLLCPIGVWVLTALGQDGTIRYDGQKFKRDFSAMRLLRFMAEEGLGKPFAEAEAQVAAMQQFLAAHDLGEVEVQGVMVFYNPNARVEAQETPLPVAVPKTVKKAIRKQGGGKLPDEVYQALEDLFDEESGWFEEEEEA